MIYDNEYCVAIAKQLVTQHGSDTERLTREIAGELNRLFALGQHAVLRLCEQVIEKGRTIKPR